MQTHKRLMNNIDSCLDPENFNIYDTPSKKEE